MARGGGNKKSKLALDDKDDYEWGWRMPKATPVTKGILIGIVTVALVTAAGHSLEGGPAVKKEVQERKALDMCQNFSGIQTPEETVAFSADAVGMVDFGDGQCKIIASYDDEAPTPIKPEEAK